MLLKIPLKGKRNMVAGYTLVRESRDWVVFVPESGADFQSGSRNELNRLLTPSLAAKFNYLVINKAGLSPRSSDPLMFERSFRRHYRVDDALTAMKRVIPSDGKIFLVGYSEGAYLAPEIAMRDARVRSVVMIGGGTRGWLKEELSHVRGKEKIEVGKQIRKIYRNSDSTEKWNDFSFATWHSYREDKTLQALRRWDRPVLALLGARDNVIDLKSALNDLKSLKAKKPVQIHLLKNCGHYFTGQWPAVRRALNEFVAAEI